MLSCSTKGLGKSETRQHLDITSISLNSAIPKQLGSVEGVTKILVLYISSTIK